MPSGSGDGDDDESEDGDENDESEVTEPDEASKSRPKAPVLFLLSAVRLTLRRVDALYERYENLPGWTRVCFGIVTFTTSAYFGSFVRAFVDSVLLAAIRSALRVFGKFPLGIRLTISLLLFLVVQISVVNRRLKYIGVKVESDDMGSDDIAPDGGMQVEHVGSSGSGAMGGAAFGAVFGAGFGYATIFGGIVLGAIVGDEIERWSERRRKRRKLKTRIVEYLLRERVFTPETVETETVRHWFPADDEGLVTEAIDALVREDDSPVVHGSDGIRLEGAPEAVAYLDRNGGRVPSAFAGPNRPPRPTGGEN